MRKWLGRLVAVGCSVAIITAMGASAAHAYQGTYTQSDGVRIRYFPVNATILGLGYPGQVSYARFGVTCAPGVGIVNGDPFWDYNEDLTTGIEGYSADAYLTEAADQYFGYEPYQGYC